MPLGRRSPGSAHRRNRLRPGFITTLGAAHVLPTHSAVGDGSLVAKEKAFIVDLRTRGLELKKQGLDAEKAGGLLTGPKGPKGHALQSAKGRKDTHCNPRNCAAAGIGQSLDTVSGPRFVMLLNGRV
jgi:hypothetical protein